MTGWLRPRQWRWPRWGAGVAGLAAAAVLAVGGAILVDPIARLLINSSNWVLAGFAVLVGFAAVWRLHQMYRTPQLPDTAGTDQPEQSGDEDENPPHQLPAPPAGFVGRAAELDRIVEAARREPAFAAVGQRGFGTSAFVLHAAHALKSRYPDGQIYVDVRGSEGRPLRPDEVLGRVCRALGLPAPRSQRQADLDAAGEKLRSWLADKQLLLVLDNVDDPEKVRRLLPNSPRSLALLAGTVDLRQLGTIHCVDIGPPSTDEAVQLLAQTAGRRLVGSDEQPARDLVGLLSRQPLAIRLLGQQLAKQSRTVEELRQEIQILASQQRYQQEGSTALRDLWDTCDMVYQRLAPRSQRMFRLLGLVPATEIGVPAAAALAGCPPNRAEQTLADLAGVGLLEPVTGGRYRLRKLLAASARLHLRTSEPEARQQRALVRMVRHLAASATGHATALAPGARPRAEAAEADRPRARRWFTREQDLLHRLLTDWYQGGEEAAGREQPPEPVQPWLYRTAVALCVWYAQEHRLPEWQDVCQAVLAMRLADTDPAVAFWARNELGAVHRQQGDPVTACDELARALQPGPHRPNPGSAQAEVNLGLAWLDRLAWRDRAGLQIAMTHFDNARRLRQDRYGQGLRHLGLSAVYLHRREPEAAKHHIERCLDIFDELNEPRGLAAALNNLGLALWLRQDHTDAEEYWEQALNRYTELDDNAGMAQVRLNLAVMLLDADPTRIEEVVSLLQQSLQWRAASSDTRGMGLCRLHLGDAYARRGEGAQAIEEWQKAREIFGELDLAAGYEEASRRLGHQ